MSHIPSPHPNEVDRRESRRSHDGGRGTTQQRLVLFALIAWACTCVVSSFYPLDRPVDEFTELSFVWAHSWVVSQAFVPIATLLIPLLIGTFIAPRKMWPVGVFVLTLVPVIVLLDCITFHWIGERFLSRTLAHIIISLLPGLLPFMGMETVLMAVALIIAVVGLAVAAAIVSSRLANRWSIGRPGDVTPLTVVGLTALLCGLIAIPALSNFNRTVAEMRDHSVRHPLCSFCLIEHRTVGRRIPSGDQAVPARLHGMGMANAVKERIEQFRQAQIVPTGKSPNHQELRPNQPRTDQFNSSQLPDGVIVIIESLQHSMISDRVMPNVHRLGAEGWKLNNHFSGGNASNLGIFSLLNGTEATYFPLAHTFEPLMNRLFRQAGYQLGFYGGTDDWAEFGMSGFIKPDYYSEFKIEAVDWIASDQRSIDRALDFLSAPDDTPQRPPRLAVVYLYSSHQPFASLPNQEVFQPTTGHRFVSPYTESQRQLIWNRYRNSLRSLDHMLQPLLRKDRFVVVVGDHGESFMDDGTIGHGTRLSEAQNMTSAMIYLPGRSPRVIDDLTMHADILPTVLAGLDLKIQPANLFEGVDLKTISDDETSDRMFATFHYMWPELLLVGPWTQVENQPFGYRAAFSTRRWQLASLNPVNKKGLEIETDSRDEHLVPDMLDDWLMQRLGINPTLEEATKDELFARYLSSDDPQVRLYAIETARSVAEPSEVLLELISERISDPSETVRQTAGETIIELQKRLGRSNSD